MDAHRDYERLRQANARLTLLSDAASTLLMDERPRDALRSIYGKLSAHLGLEVYFNYWVTDDGLVLRLDSFAGVPEGVARRIERIEFGQGVCGTVAAHRRRIVAENIQRSTEPVTQLVRALGIEAYACHPLIARDRLFGTLSFGTRRRSRFEADELELMQTIANQMAMAIERQRLIADLAERNARLELANATLRTVIDAMPAGVVVVRAADRRVTVANRRAEEMVGLPAVGASLDGGGVPDGTGVGACAPRRSPIEQALANGDVVENVELRVSTRGGQEATVLAGAAPIRDGRGGITSAVATFLDITDRKRVEDGQRFLAEASTRLAASLDYEATLAGVARLAVPRLGDRCIIDLIEPDQSIRRVAVAHANPAREPLAQRLRSYPPAADGPHPVAATLRTGRPELVPEVTDAWLAARTSDPAYRRLLRELGTRSFMCVPLVARGRTLGVISLAMESARRYGPDDLALAEEVACRAALAVDNARLYREARESVRKAQEAVHARDAFLARASHELRTPLTSALGTVRLLKRAMAGALKEPPEALVDIASRNLDTMLALINSLLDASKLTAGGESLALEPVDVAALVAGALDVVGPQAREKGVALRAAIPIGVTAPAVDRLKLEQVLLNLTANAVTFTPAGGSVTVSAGVEDGQVVLRVRDTGEGILPQHLESVFEPFFQASGWRARRRRGTGLGLAICRQIVGLHGGRIWAESDGPGRGSTFVVALPAEQVGRHVA